MDANIPLLTSISNNVPLKFELGQNYPNPFNPQTTITYQIPSTNFVRLTIYNTFGQTIKTIVNNWQLAGNYTIHFDAGNLASGIYFYELSTGNKILHTKKMVLLR